MNLEVIGRTVERIVFLPFFFLIIIFTLIFFAIGIIFCIWVYRDAKSRGMDGTLWVLIVFIANFIGLIIYLFVREDKRMEVTPREGARYCAYCGKQISIDSKFCEICGKKV